MQGLVQGMTEHTKYCTYCPVLHMYMHLLLPAFKEEAVHKLGKHSMRRTACYLRASMFLYEVYSQHQTLEP